MKKLNFVLDAQVESVYDSKKQEILVVSLSDERIGFICVNKSQSDDDNTFTPFTQFGLLADEDCISCALSTLFRIRTNLKLKGVGIPATEADHKAMFFAAIINAVNNAGNMH